MRCRQARPRLVDYLYGELVPGERDALERHLASCGACSREKAALEGITQALDRGEVLAVSPELRAGLEERVRAALRETAEHRSFGSWLQWTFGPFVNAFKPALGGVCLALVLAALAVMRLGDWSRYGSSLLIIGIVWGGASNSIVRCMMNGRDRAGGSHVNLRLVVWGGIAATAVAVALGFLLPVPAAYEMPQFRPWYAALSQRIPYEVAYYQPLIYAFLATTVCGIYIGRKAPTRKGTHAALAGCIYVLIMVPALFTQCFPFSMDIFLAWAAGSAVGAAAGGVLGGTIGKRL